MRFLVIDALTTQLHGRCGLQGQVERAQTNQLCQLDGRERLLEVRRGHHHQRRGDHRSRGKGQKTGILKLETERGTKGWESLKEKRPEHGESLGSRGSALAGASQVKWRIPMIQTWSDASSDEKPSEWAESALQSRSFHYYLDS